MVTNFVFGQGGQFGDEQPLGGWQGVGVGIERDAARAVAEPLLDEMDRDPPFEEQRGVGVAERVRRTGQPGPCDQRLHDGLHGAHGERRAVAAIEDGIVLLPGRSEELSAPRLLGLLGGEHLDRCRVERDAPATGCRLGPAHEERGSRQVDVAPAQVAGLAHPQAGRRQDEEEPAVAVLGSDGEEAAEFVQRPGAGCPLGAGRRRSFQPVGR